MQLPDRLIEVSWEVANKVGGIHTVVSSKASFVRDRVQSYLTIGPLRDQLDQQGEFIQSPAPSPVQQVFDEFRDLGIHCTYGSWTVRVSVPCILIDARNATFNLDAVKGLLWEQFAVDSLNSGYDFDEPLRWAWAVGKFVERFNQVAPAKTVLHGHEWLSGGSLLYQQVCQSGVATVFTTHATMLGRSLSSRGLHPAVHEQSNPAQAARDMGVVSKHSLEVACAHASDAFTTVSQVTADEAEMLYDIRPIVVCNGLDDNYYPTQMQASKLHRRARSKLIELLDDHFASSGQAIAEDQLTIVCTSGRYEIHNKGYDCFLDALAKLNTELKAASSQQKLIACFFIPFGHQGARPELLRRRAAIESLAQFFSAHAKEYARRSIDCDRTPDIVDDFSQQSAQIRDHLSCTRSNAPLSTHLFSEGQQQELIARASELGLRNAPNDPVRILWYPVYLKGSDGLLDLTYNEAVAACDGAVFPSFYEPWGYTPAESAALSVPTLTTDLSGFGRFIQENQIEGVSVIRRSEVSDEQVTEQILLTLLEWINCDDQKFLQASLLAKQASTHVSWKHFINQYFEVYSNVSNRT